MFMVVVMALDGAIEDVVGPFWYEDTAEKWARDTERRHNRRCAVRQVRERKEWSAAQ